MKRDFTQAVDLYLATRRNFGYALTGAEFMLRSFVRYLKAAGHTGPLTAALALQWAAQPQQVSPVYLAVRLQTVRLFTQFWQAYDPRTEIPPRGWFGPSTRRRAVHIYSGREVGRLLESASNIDFPHPFRGQTLRVLIGLLACTGLRVGEALGLCDADIDWAAGVLTIRHAKGGHTRLIPVQHSTLEALQRYRALRDKTIRPAVAPCFFVNYRGRPQRHGSTNWSFRQLCRRLGWTQSPIPRLHDLRHTFVVRTLLAWYRTHEPIEAKLWSLSTYLGHQHPSATYWYLSAVPQLLQLAQKRFASAQTRAHGGMFHD